MNEVVVTSRSEVSSDNFTSSHIILKKKKLEQEQDVLDVLRKTPGIFIDQTGGPGSQAAIHIRGSEVRHVLVLIDGVKIFDPSNTDRHFNAAFLNLTDVKRIEILKGAQSHLYGADAIGGVINIITHKKKSKDGKYFSASVGANNMLDVSLSNSFGLSTLFINAFIQQSELISAAAGGNEKDEMQSKGVTVNWGQGIGSTWWSSFMLKHQFSENDTDAGAFIDDESAKAITGQQIYSWTLEQEKSNYNFKSQLSLTRHDRENISNYGNYPFYGQNLSWEANLNKKLGRHTFAGGVRLENEEIATKDIEQRSVDMSGIHAQYFYKTNTVFANTGIRADSHQIFGSVGNFGLGVGRHWGKKWTIKSQLASGYKAPSLYQLYAQDLGAPFNCKVGNQNLAPEKSRSLDVGLIRNWTHFKLESTLFYSDINDYIDYQCDAGYKNVTSYHSQGLELALGGELPRDLQVEVSITAAKFERDNGLEVPRRPNLQSQINLEYDLSDEVSFSLQHRIVGKRYDYVLGDELILKEYQLTDLNIKWQSLQKKWQLQFMVKNLFDQYYQEVAGFNRPGLNSSVRFKATF